MSAQLDQVLAQAANDPDVMETQEWLDALEAVIETEGPERAHYLMERMVDLARRRGAEGDRLAGVEDVVGGQGDDVLRGSGRGQELRGGHGEDLIQGRGGDDKLIGEAGVVVLSGPLGIHRDGKPGPMGDIAKLKGDAVITAKMLPRSRWAKDQHGEAVPTIQARDINLKS